MRTKSWTSWPAAAGRLEFSTGWHRRLTGRNIGTIPTNRTIDTLPDKGRCNCVCLPAGSAGRSRSRLRVGRRLECNGLRERGHLHRILSVRRPPAGTGPTAKATSRKLAGGIVPFAGRRNRFALPSVAWDRAGCRVEAVRLRSASSSAGLDANRATIRTRATGCSRTSTGLCKRFVPKGVVCYCNNRRHPPSPAQTSTPVIYTSSNLVLKTKNDALWIHLVEWSSNYVMLYKGTRLLSFLFYLPIYSAGPAVLSAFPMEIYGPECVYSGDVSFLSLSLCYIVSFGPRTGCQERIWVFFFSFPFFLFPLYVAIQTLEREREREKKLRGRQQSPSENCCKYVYSRCIKRQTV